MNFLNLNPHWHRLMEPLPKGFREYRKNALADLAEIRHSYASICSTSSLKIVCSGQVRSQSDQVIHDVIFGRNKRIVRSIVSGRVALLCGVFLHCMQHAVHPFQFATFQTLSTLAIPMICIVNILEPQFERVISKLGTWYSTSTWITSFAHCLFNSNVQNRTWVLEGTNGASEA